MKPDIRKTLTTCALIAVMPLAAACTTHTTNTYDERPYEYRTAGEGEKVKDVDMHYKHKKDHKDCSKWKSRAMKAEEKAARLESRLSASLRK